METYIIFFSNITFINIIFVSLTTKSQLTGEETVHLLLPVVQVIGVGGLVPDQSAAIFPLWGHRAESKSCTSNKRT